MSENRQVGRPRKDPSTILNKKFSFLMNFKQISFIDDFIDRGAIIRTIIFELMPKIIDKFADLDVEMELSTKEWNILEKYVKWGETNG